VSGQKVEGGLSIPREVSSVPQEVSGEYSESAGGKGGRITPMIMNMSRRGVNKLLSGQWRSTIPQWGTVGEHRQAV